MHDATNTASTRVLLLAFRQALLIALGALEDYLGLPRSVVPKHKREEGGMSVRG